MMKNILFTSIIIFCCLFTRGVNAQTISTSDYYFFQDGKTKTAGVDTARFLLYSLNNNINKAVQWKRNSHRVSFFWKFQIVNITNSNDTLYNVINRTSGQYMCAMADGTVQDLSLSRSDDNDVNANRWKLIRVNDPNCPAGGIAVAMEAYKNDNTTTGRYLKITPDGSNSYYRNDLAATISPTNDFNWFLIKNQEAPTPPPFTARVCQDATELKLDVYRRDNSYLTFSDYSMALYDSTNVQINTNNVAEGLSGNIYQVYLENTNNKPTNITGTKGTLTLPLVAANKRSSIYESTNGYFMVQASYTAASGLTCKASIPLNVRVVSNTAVWKPEKDASSNLVASDNWNSDNNWTIIDTTNMDIRYAGGVSIIPRIASIPMGCTNVFIPGSIPGNEASQVTETFPVLKNYSNNLDVLAQTEKNNFPKNKILKTDGTYRYDVQQGFNSNPVCKDIVFKMGGQLGRQDLLTYQRAFVELNFGETGESNKFKNSDHGVTDLEALYSDTLSRNRWYMLSVPLKKVVTGDYMFAGFPYVYYRFFDEVSPQTNKAAIGDWTTSFNTLNVEPRAGQGVLYWVNGNANGNTKPFFNQKNLDKIHGIVRFPSFQKDLVLDGGSTDARTNHIFDPSIGISRFTYFDNTDPSKHLIYPHWHDESTLEAGNPYSYDRYAVTDQNGIPKSKSNASYRFYPEILQSDGTFVFPQGDFTVQLSTPKRPEGATSDPATRFVCIGNPFMSQLDFYAFALANFGIQASGYSYQVFSAEKSYLTQLISHDGSVLSGVKRFIPPMQSFIMEVPFQTTTVKFNAQTMSTAYSNNYGTPSNLRAEELPDKILQITASNSFGKSETFIAKRDWASDTFVPLEDKSKLLSFDGNIPDVYTTANNFAVSYNFIQSENLTIPLRIGAGNIKEDIKLTFAGANDFSAEKIELVDGISGKLYDLRERDSFTLPAEGLMEEGRYFIRFGSGQTTNLDKVSSEKLIIYADPNKILHIVSSPESLIQEVALFNMQGQKIQSSDKLKTTSCTFDLSGYSGIFIAKVKTSKTTTNRSFIVH